MNNSAQVLIDSLNNQINKVVLPVLEGYEIVKLRDIIRCQGNGNLTDFHFLQGGKMVICRTLKFYDEILSEYGFLRVHKSHIVNLNCVKSFRKGKQASLVMSDNSTVEVSPSKRDELLNRLSNQNIY